jgi:hypothetical protein
MAGKLFVPALLLCLACSGRPQAADKSQQGEEDYSFEAVAVQMSEQDAKEQARAKLRESYKDEVQRCEGRGGEWMSPGVCCQWTAYGCNEEKP